MNEAFTIEQVKEKVAVINSNIEILSNIYKNNSTKLDCKV